MAEYTIEIALISFVLGACLGYVIKGMVYFKKIDLNINVFVQVIITVAWLLSVHHALGDPNASEPWIIHAFMGLVFGSVNDRAVNIFLKVIDFLWGEQKDEQ